MKFTKFLLLLVLVAPTLGQTPAVSDGAKSKLLTSYQKAVIANYEFVQAQNTANAAFKAYNDLVAETVKSEKLPEGTYFQVNVDSGSVTPVFPPAKPAEPAKPEKK